ncbi:iron complex outermembrane receptor protein [Aquabacterium commune]|uniref:Iron complex outermembrane receptor protein n=1 Tax=Aquabacterium commune TaxID=70586 RepID=A0A4R6RNK1_9BURK|nr:TonB-dependent receptor [Aquabacterium commune]TDP88184.1 iron complex outermembrane receptor protein [Aquabacterium commune]
MFFVNSVRVAPGVRSAVAVACGVLSALSWGAARADEVDPVVVSASRMPQLLRTAPIGATVITAEQIERSGVSDANEAIRKLGGVPARADLTNGRENKIDLRGFGDAASQNVVVLVDGIRLSENENVTARLSAIPLDRIDRIEIVRGSSSVMWGEGASAGAINVILKQPEGARDGAAVTSGRVQAAVASFGGHELGASGEYGMGPWLLDAAVKRVRDGGWRENAEYRQDVGSFGAQLRLKDVRAAFRVQHEDQASRLPGALSFEDARQRPRSTDTPRDYANASEMRYTTQLAWQASPAWALQLDAGKRERTSASRYVSFGSAEVRSNSQQSQLTPTVRYAQDFSGVDVKAVSGVDLQEWRFDKTGSLGLETGTQRNRAFFARGDVALPTATRISAGWRSETVNKVGNFPGTGGSFGLPASVYNRDDHLYASELGLSQTVIPGWEVYGRAATSYRLANIDENRLTPSQGPLRPQRNSDREIGVKWAQGAQSATVRYFTQKTRDEIVYDASVFANANIDPTQRKGVEAEGRWQATQRLSVSAVVQQLTARFREGVNAGKEMVLVAPRSATLRASWRIDDHQTLDAGVQFLAASRYSGDESNGCSMRVPSSTLLDARYAWSDRDWTLAVSGNNLTDRRGFDYGYAYTLDGSNPCGASATVRGVYPYAGRSLKLAVTRRF